jgi:hypothetical protein
MTEPLVAFEAQLNEVVAERRLPPVVLGRAVGSRESTVQALVRETQGKLGALDRLAAALGCSVQVRLVPDPDREVPPGVMVIREAG